MCKIYCYGRLHTRRLLAKNGYWLKTVIGVDLRRVFLKYLCIYICKAKFKEKHGKFRKIMYYSAMYFRTITSDLQILTVEPFRKMREKQVLIIRVHMFNMRHRINC